MPFDPVPAVLPLSPNVDPRQRAYDLRLLKKTAKSLREVGWTRRGYFATGVRRGMLRRRVTVYCVVGWLNVHAGQDPARGNVGPRIARDILRPFLPTGFQRLGCPLPARDIMRFNDGAESVDLVIALVERAIHALESEAP